MTKILIIVFMLISMLAINDCSPEPKIEVKDGCEYISFYKGFWSFDSNAWTDFVHKGDCKNPIHKQENK